MKLQILIMDNNPVDFEKIKEGVGSDFSVSLFSQSGFENSVHDIDSVFIRMDATVYNSLSWFKRIREQYPNIHLVWMSSKKQDACTAFEYAADAFLLLPPTDQTLSDVIKRLDHIRNTRHKDC